VLTCSLALLGIVASDALTILGKEFEGDVVVTGAFVGFEAFLHYNHLFKRYILLVNITIFQLLEVILHKGTHACIPLNLPKIDDPLLNVLH
jgi:hypothetical protein